MPRFGKKISAEERLSVFYSLTLNLLGLVLIGLGLVILWSYIQAPTPVHSDFNNDYRAAQALRSGRSIYAATNAHPPCDALLFVPLSYLSSRVAFVLWSLFSILCYFGTIFFILSELPVNIPSRWRLPVLGLTLCWYPLLAHIALGQWSLFLGASLVLGWGALRRGEERLAGILFGLATAIKLFPALVGILLLLRRKWCALAWMVSLVIITLLLSVQLVGMTDVFRYFLILSPENVARYATFPVNVSLTGLISRFFVAGRWVRPWLVSPRLAKVIIFSSSLLLLADWGWQTWYLPPGRHGDDLAFAYVLLAMLLLSPITWQHVFPLLLLPLGILIRAGQRASQWRYWWLMLLIFILLSIPDVQLAQYLAMKFSPHGISPLANLIFAAPTVALLLLWYLLHRLSVELMSNSGYARWMANSE